ncbi:TMAO reductase system periplasmic protein TorT [Desulfovibrio sp. JC010]|uniref:TMAO reductase system periplasmic protein TorT n=1 Tax=Desulfovibrio sp. JC010 TaxID=2593641 RepID=UPI0013D577B0|nr:TMAO reductase system periplasmic protein TorT [Desulfovibrio sp. JC010]NDV27473.1 TMAO reductase system periplasmic protein TorT [Desulfovibrio sp. JC010]
MYSSEIKFYSSINNLFVIFGLAVLVLLAAGTSAVAAEDSWWPIQVKSYYGSYDAQSKVPGQASTNLKGPKLEEWNGPQKVNRPYTIGVSFPHIKDSYWIAVNYGIIEEARRLGIGIKLLEAGGYDHLEKQIEQLQELSRADVDGIVLGSISYSGVDSIVAELSAKGIPVVEVINDVHAPQITAKALVSFYDMGYYAGEFLAEQAEKSGRDNLKIAFFPGPKASGWAPETLHGFEDAMQYFPGSVEIVSVKWGDTGRVQQSRLVHEALAEHTDVDYLVGNAVAADVAPGILELTGRSAETGVVSTYIIPDLYDKIVKGQVMGSPSDLTVFQGRMAVDMMVRILNGEKPGRDFPFRSGPFIPTVTTENIDSYPYDGLFGPRDYKPVFELGPEK